jgi:hypothetical protein
MSYGDFRTGETFQSIKDMLWVSSDDSSGWKYKRRHTVLGKWRMLKLELWKQHVDNCGDGDLNGETSLLEY